MSNKVQKFVVFDSVGNDHDVVAFDVQSFDSPSGWIVLFHDSAGRVVASFLNPSSYSVYNTENSIDVDKES